MLAVNYTNLRDNMKSYMDQVTDDYETMIVTRLRHSQKKEILLLIRYLRQLMMNKVFTDNGWEDYTYWQTEDKKTLKKINNLIKDIDRNGNEGIGKPEPLTGNLTGFWSRRINDKDRLIYKIDDKNIYILSCRYHYNDK